MSLSPNFKAGDPLKAETLNEIVRAIQDTPRTVLGGDGLAVRKGAGRRIQITATRDRPILIRLTANGDANGNHGWQQIVWDPSVPGWVNADSGSSSNNDPAVEVSGLACPLGDQIYEARRDERGALIFAAVDVEGVTSTSFTAGSITSLQTGTVALYSLHSGAPTSSGLSVTASNRWATAWASGKGVSLRPWNGKWLISGGDC